MAVNIFHQVVKQHGTVYCGQELVTISVLQNIDH